MMDITKSREEFHKWLEEAHGLYGEDIDWQPERNCYRIFGIHLAWCAWQSSRESIEVELPAKVTAKDTNWTTPNKMREALALSLRTAGIRIKGESDGTK
ncbi:hypothetical protein ACQIBV_003897 [Yersinia enterocolitica]|nr:hypothetical protein [Yersinia enterocolitica]EKN4062514.1 hypothetical protein [Yersinia enterocolitica]HDL6709162.1 hypothetical protein [Yersinia enterocolitica]HEN3414923.1 hypothetical protein [Yersinia enterocolitica]